MKFEYLWIKLKSKVRMAFITISIWLNPRFWILFNAVLKQFKYDFGFSVLSKNGIALVSSFGDDTPLGRIITSWSLDTGMQLSPIWLKEL